MVDPSLLAGTPHRNRTAFLDLIGTLSMMYAGLMQATITLTGRVPARYPLDANGPQQDVLQAIQSQHQALARALQITDPPDLQSFNLADPTDFASWTFILSRDLTRLKTAAGVL